MPKLSELEYRVAAINENGKRVYLEDLVDSLTWEEADGELAQRCTFSLPNIKLENGRVAKLLGNGAVVKVWAGYDKPLNNVFTGKVFRNKSSYSPNPRIEVTAYDELYYLMQSEDDRYYRAGKTGEAIIRDLCRAWGIPLGKVEGPSEKLSKKMFQGMLIGEMITKVLAETRKKGGGRWIVQADEGKVNVIKRGKNTPFVFEGEEIGDLGIERSIESLVTRVKIVGRDKGGSKVLATLDGDLDFGTLQRVVSRGDFDSPGAAKKAATQMIKDEGAEAKMRTFLAPDIPGLRRGQKVIVRARTLDGPYIVSGIVHDGKNKTMSVQVEDRKADAVDVDFEESGLWDWIPPDDRHDASGGKSTGTPGKKSSAGFQWPLRGVLTSPFGDGRNHGGIDIDCETGDPILASKPGKVTIAGSLDGYGYVVYIDHGNGQETRYGHLSRFGVKVGDDVGYSRVIGYGGNTGRSTGSHLHFEIRMNGSAVDPLSYLP